MCSFAVQEENIQIHTRGALIFSFQTFYFLMILSRLAAKQSYYLPFVRTNYGKFNIRFQGPSLWNCIDKDIKLSSKAMFKKKIQAQYLKKY